MTKAEAKRLVCQCVAAYMDPRNGHDNTFVRVGDFGKERSVADEVRVRHALVDLCDELYLRAQSATGNNRRGKRRTR